MINEKVIVIRSSDNFYFFKKVLDKMTWKHKWKRYASLKHRGSMFFTRGNKRI